MSWWQTLLSTAVGAIVGGAAVIAAEAIRQARAAAESVAAWEREREARRRDDQRRWLLELQEAVADVGRASALVATEDARMAERHPETPYGTLLVGTEIAEAARLAILKVNMLAARIADDVARRTARAVIGQAALVSEADSRHAADHHLEAAIVASYRLNDRVTELLLSL